MRRPARSPPACSSVRPPNRMTIFSPSPFMLLRWPALNPSPIATIRTIEEIPQAIPAIVRNVRSLLRNRLSTTCPTSSDKYVMALLPILLENDLLTFSQAFDDFGFGAIADTGGNRDLADSLLIRGIGNLRRSRFVFVIEDGSFRDC